MNKNIIQAKLDLLYEELEEADGEQQYQYLKEEIDYYKTQLLKIMTSEKYEQIEKQHRIHQQ